MAPFLKFVYEIHHEKSLSSYEINILSCSMENALFEFHLLSCNHYLLPILGVSKWKWVLASELEGNTTVAHTGKTQLNSCSETQQSFEEHNNLVDNATIFFRPQQSFREHNKLFENTTIFSRTQQSIREHNNRFGNTKVFSRTQGIFLMHNNPSFPKHNNIFWYTNAN